MIAALSIAAALAATPADALITVNPITLAAPGRGQPLQVRVTAPVKGGRLPVIVFSHGSQYAKDDYLTLTEFWAAHGFAVIQPTHLDALVLGPAVNEAARAGNWRTRSQDISHVIDALAQIEALVPSLRGRLDRRHVIAAGHSYGGYTVQTLIGMRPIDPATGRAADLADPRVIGVVSMAPPGGGAEGDLKPGAKARSPYLKVDWSRMTGRALVVVGDEDESVMTNRDWTWHADAYRLAPGGGKCLLVVSKVQHYLGGVLGPNRTEAGEPAPQAVALVQSASLAFMQTLVNPADPAWSLEKAVLTAKPERVAAFECR